MSVDHLLVNDDGAVLEFVFNRSDRGNALTYRMAIEMTERIVDAARGDITRVIVIRGEGKDFCSGMDLVESNASTGQKPRTGNLERRMSWGPHRLMEAISAVQLPVVTVVRGYAAGIGFALALSGDYIVADDTAKFWAPYVARGFTPDSGITWLVPKLVGMARAKDALLRARKINAEEAHEWGMINALVTADDLEAESQLVVDEFARCSHHLCRPHEAIAQSAGGHLVLGRPQERSDHRGIGGADAGLRGGDEGVRSAPGSRVHRRVAA